MTRILFVCHGKPRQNEANWGHMNIAFTTFLHLLNEINLL